MKIMTNRLGKLLDDPHLTLLIVTETLFLWMVTNNPLELANKGGGLVFLHVTAVCLLQMAILATLHRIVRARGVAAVYGHRFAFAAVLVFNIYTVLLIHIPSEGALYAYKGIISGVLLLMIVLLFSVRPWKFIGVGGLAFGMIIGIQFLLGGVTSEAGNVAMPKIAAGAKFERRPNVYFLSFDALIPTDIVDSFLHQPEPKYSLYLKKHDFREVKNSFAAYVPTRESLNAVAAVDTKYCDNLGEDCWGLVIGKVPSPLYAVFKKNGYKTFFAYHNNYFGNKKGPYLDRYVVEVFSVCRHISEGWAFLGYCWLERHLDLNRVFRSIFPTQSIEALIASGAEPSPIFVMAYIYSPGHAPPYYDTYNPSDFREYQESFAKNQLETVRRLETLIEAVRTRDPNSVVVVFGDHGAWLSRSWESNRGEPDSAGIVWTEDLVTLERHRVALFVYPKDFCVDEIGDLYTLNRLGRSVAKCLSNGQDPFPDSRHDGGRDWSRYVVPK